MVILRISLLFFISLLAVFSYGSDTLNTFNKVGNKQGLWVSKNGDLQSEYYYKNGEKAGVYKVYHQNGRIYSIGEYKNNKLTGTALVFDERGILLSREDSIQLNKSEVFTVTNRKVTRLYSSHIYYYNMDGSLDCDGLILYDDDPDNESLRFGIWTFYNSKEEIIRKVDYSDKYLINFDGIEIK